METDPLFLLFDDIDILYTIAVFRSSCALLSLFKAPTIQQRSPEQTVHEHMNQTAMLTY